LFGWIPSFIIIGLGERGGGLLTIEEEKRRAEKRGRERKDLWRVRMVM